MSAPLLQQIKRLIEEGKQYAARQVNSTITLTYFLVGKYIVEDEQRGAHTSNYAAQTLKFLSAELSKVFGRGYSVDNLENMRRFYLTFQNKLKNDAIGISETLSRKFLLSDSEIFKLSWSHYILLSRIENEAERSFYEAEAITGNWGLRD